MAGAPHPKPAKRVKDKLLMRRIHFERRGTPCDYCGFRVGTQLHHRKHRSQGGDDSRANLAWLCVYCHTRAHSGFKAT